LDTDDRTDDCACRADDVALPGWRFRKIRFLMIADSLLPGTHKDPFDRMLIAQAQAENMPIVSNEVLFDTYGVRRIW
jgi:PIN domain nuclease of toxin-antitoxin system